MIIYSFILTLSTVGAVQVAVTYEGCFQLSGSPPNSPIVTYNQNQNLSLQNCINQAISVGAAAFGLRVPQAGTSGYCYTGPLSSFTAIANLSAATYCNEYAPGDNLHPCGMRYIGSVIIYTAVVYKVVYLTCFNTSWSAWSACSQTCDNGVQNRYQILNNGTGCNSTTIYQYQSCSNAATCQAKSSASTPLRTQCTSLNGYYAYSSCYFLATSSGNAGTICTAQSAMQASLFGTDLVSQLGSVFLQSNSIIGVTSLQYVSSSLQWVLNATNYPFLSNATIASPTQSCVSLISNKNSSGNAPELPHLNYTACSSSPILPMCMKSNHIYSSYTTITGNLITELQSPESSTTEPDVHSCGARCSRIISCLGFNFRSSDLSCIPTKVSIRTPTTISGSQVYSIQVDPTWTFFDRI